ncbi:hypothetical protein BAU15_11390 [Enterococcus sp. JM4C]|uniref:hypothetical protein n=1 Tax=Candidatus Enterococcus huntleyi TaxID=1857217 RepID=UPI00137B8F09|nr:hypothetical protein [Enterococcus sp. JM4C]KAF1297346.1 hypothetical protein BAU15_11390 [Enterococcus sp. JM4C]
MKFKQLIIGEFYQGKKSFMLFVLSLLLTLGAFMTALPIELLQRNSAAPAVSVGLYMPMDNREITGLIGVLDHNQLIEKLEIVSQKQGKLGVAKGEYDLYIELPENFEEALFERQMGTVKLYAKNAIIGNIVYQIIYEMIQTLNNLQSLSLDYYQVLKTSDLSYTEARKMSQTFDLQLIQMLLDRDESLTIHKTIAQYPLQLSALFLFISLAGISLFSGLLSSQQIRQGTIKKLLFYKYPIALILGAKFLLSWLLSLPFLLFLWQVAKYFGLVINGGRLLIGATCLLAVLFILTTGIAFLVSRARKESQLFLLYAGGAFLMLFLGGLIYPLYQQPAFLTRSNPAWYAQVVIEQAVSGATWDFSPYFKLLLVSGVLAGGIIWRCRRWN